MTEWDRLADDETIERTVRNLVGNGIEVKVFATGAEAKDAFFGIVPEGAQMMRANSVTLQQTGIAKQLEGGNYEILQSRLAFISDEERRTRARRSLMNPDYGVGSVNAITESGELVVASSSGSQIGFYAYGANRLVLVAGAQKIVKDLDEALRRIREYTVPLVREDKYNSWSIEPGTGVNKLLIIGRESTPGRITLILVKERVGV
jgi:LUD domain